MFPVYLHRASDEQFFERFPELSGHAAVDGEVDRITDDDEEIGEQHQQICHGVVEYFFDAAWYYVQHLNSENNKNRIILTMHLHLRHAV